MTELLCKAILKLQEIFKRFFFLSGKHSRSPTKKKYSKPGPLVFRKFHRSFAEHRRDSHHQRMSWPHVSPSKNGYEG